MKYALGNMLNGAGGLNADQLALDLQFAADKTLTARRGPTPVLTRGSTGTFVGSNGLIQSAGNNVARFDHDPVTLASRGLLIEEGRTNLFVHSEDLTQTAWGRNGSTISANATTSPDGATTADGIVDDTTTLQHRVVQSFNAISGTTYTVSCFIKRNQVTDFFQIGLASANFGTNSTWFNISNGTIVSSTGTASASTITAFPNGWYRVTHTATCTTSNIAANAFLSPSTNSSTVNYTGTGVLTVYIWGAQVEAGSFATSYIPTTTSALARSADVCSITGTNFTGLWNASEGSTFFNGISAGRGSGAFGNTALFLDIASDTSNRLTQIATGSGAIRPDITRLGASQYNPTALTYANNTVARQSFGFRSGETSSAFLNNTAFSGGTNIALTMPSVNGLYIGSSSVSGNFCNGTISAIRYYRKRLANAKLQALTV